MAISEEHFRAILAVVEQNPDFAASFSPANDDDLHAYIQHYYGYTLPRTVVCDGHTSPFNALADAFFGRVLNAIWLGPRTGGKTLQFALLDVLMMKHYGTTIANIGAIEEQAKKCYGYIKDFLSLPAFRDDIRGESLMSVTTLNNGARVEIMPATMNRVNSPHPERAHWDEVELISEKILSEGASMPVRTNGRPPATIFTSTRKRAYGTMEMLLEEAEKRALSVSTWCVWEIAEQCPPERHHDGAKTGCGSCKLEEVCRERATDENGVEHYLPGPGKAARSRGWMPIEDIIQKFISMDRAVFDAQWLCLRPETSGLAYPMFKPETHVIDYEYNPTYPVVCGIDYGFTNPSVAVYAQPTPNDDVVIFAEDYQAGRTADEFAHSIVKSQWFRNTAWRVADHDSGDSATLRAFGVETEPANKHSQIMNLPNVVGGISVVRWALKPMGRRRPILYISRRCTNLIREMKQYHHPDEKDDRSVDERPVKVNDHACDAMRYMLVRLYRGMLNV